MASGQFRHVLDGYKVLDFTQFVAGPTVTRLMAAMGAEIIKVELAPDGDRARLIPYVRDNRSAYYVQHNLGKMSLCLDARHPEGVAILRELAIRGGGHGHVPAWFSTGACSSSPRILFLPGSGSSRSRAVASCLATGDLPVPPWRSVELSLEHAGAVDVRQGTGRGLGTQRFLRFYFLCGCGAGVCAILAAYLGGSSNVPIVGSSGAIYGILAAYAALWPERDVLFIFFPMKVKYFVILIGAINFLISYNGSAGQMALLTGLLFGLLYVKSPRVRGLIRGVHRCQLSSLEA